MIFLFGLRSLTRRASSTLYLNRKESAAFVAHSTGTSTITYCTQANFRVSRTPGLYLTSCDSGTSTFISIVVEKLLPSGCTMVLAS